jgi:tyrosinase
MGSTTKKGNTANPGLSRAAEVPPPSFVVVSGPFELTIHAAATGNLYLSWTPTQCTLRITNAPQPAQSIVLKNRDVAVGGQVVFRTSYSSANADTLPLTVPGDGSTVSFFIAGKFGKPSFHDQDGCVSINHGTTDAALHQRSLMVRIRKDANVLTIAERDRFLAAYASLNANTAAYQVFLDSHNSASNNEIHGHSTFLPWHRAFVLDIERQIQAIDASVAMPYWRFERTAPNVFDPGFMGGDTDSITGRVTMNATNPLRNWTVGATTGVIRNPGFNRTTGAPTLLNESNTLGLGTTFQPFTGMEGDPHGSAHVSFNTGPILSPSTSTQDPIFFMLHCNVDRIWALWQAANNHWDVPNTATYNEDTGPSAVRDGDRLADTLWPWNGITGGTRPATAPGGPMPQLSYPSKPSPLVTVQELIDYIGHTQGNSNNFDYDDVPWE